MILDQAESAVIACENVKDEVFVVIKHVKRVDQK